MAEEIDIQIEEIVEEEAAKKTSSKRSPKPVQVEQPSRNYDYVKQKNLMVCQACGVQVQTNSNGVKTCPIRDNNCPRENA